MSDLHVAIIMDGNGRWAAERGMGRWRGHLAGVDSVRDVVRGCPDLGVGTLTLYAFSSDNWKRPRGEVGRLFSIMRRYCRLEREELKRNGVRMTAIGRRDRLPRSALRELELTEEATAGETRLHLRLAIDYSARANIARAVRELSGRESGNGESLEELLGRAIRGTVADPDLLIRTAGEQRLSDFLLWEVAYSELYFTPKYWPEFRSADLAAALDEYGRRDRRYGGLGETLRNRRVG